MDLLGFINPQISARREIELHKSEILKTERINILPDFSTSSEGGRETDQGPKLTHWKIT